MDRVIFIRILSILYLLLMISEYLYIAALYPPSALRIPNDDPEPHSHGLSTSILTGVGLKLFLSFL